MTNPIKKYLGHVYCAILSNGHDITADEEDTILTNEKQYFDCSRCGALVVAWVDSECEEDYYWLQEI